MGSFTVLDKLISSTSADSLYGSMTIGEVISSNDPQQMGRLQVYVPALDNDKDQALPWAYYCSAFGGVSDAETRGPSQLQSNGPVSYGMWAVPKTGAMVLIMCIDQNPDMRVWLGCVPGLQFPHTMPHGRYVDKDGPLTSSEGRIEPLYAAQTEMFNGTTSQVEPRESYEYITRGSDRQVASLSDIDVGTFADYSSVSDDTDSTGYGSDNHNDSSSSHSNVYSFTTPGFHSWSMDDNATSCRVRLRSASGNQIILDDTNERIYINTAHGKTWIELDDSGTIDIYSQQDLSLRSEQDINIVSDKTVRIAGKEGVHISSQDDLRMHSGGGIHIKTDGDIRSESDNLYITTETDFHTSVAGDIRAVSNNTYHESVEKFNILSPTVHIGSAINVDGSVGITGSLDAIGRIASGDDVTSPTHSLNSHTHTYILPDVPAAPIYQPGTTAAQLIPTGVSGVASASPESAESEEAEASTAFFPSRVPQHEPYARVYLDIAQTDTDEVNLTIFDVISTEPDSVSEFAYTDEAVGTGSPARGKTFTRNSKWQR